MIALTCRVVCRIGFGGWRSHRRVMPEGVVIQHHPSSPIRRSQPLRWIWPRRRNVIRSEAESTPALSIAQMESDCTSAIESVRPRPGDGAGTTSEVRGTSCRRWRITSLPARIGCGIVVQATVAE